MENSFWGIQMMCASSNGIGYSDNHHSLKNECATSFGRNYMGQLWVYVWFGFVCVIAHKCVIFVSFFVVE